MTEVAPADEGRRRAVLRVASYNVHDLKEDRGAAARVVRRIAPDVLCLQEIPRHPLSGHRVADFAEACGLLFSGGHHGSGGTTVLTGLRVQTSSSAHHPLPVRRLRRPRGYAVAHVALPGRRPLTVVSIHLGLDATERERHVQAVLAEVDRDDSLVVAGDLNERSDGAAWGLLGRRLPAVTGQEPTFPARAPRHRIDAIFASPDLRPVRSTDVDGAVDLDAHDLTVASDHLPVWADLRLVH